MEATMNRAKIPMLGATLLLAVLAVGAPNVHAAEEMGDAPIVSQKEMPLVRGDTWQKMTDGEKVAFVWGMGHVITMERERMERFPDLKKESFAVKMAEGLAGMPMNEVVSVVDQFYGENPDKTKEPVVKVIWTKIVKSREGGDTNPPAGK
jgi:hypothetical protein